MPRFSIARGRFLRGSRMEQSVRGRIFPTRPCWTLPVAKNSSVLQKNRLRLKRIASEVGLETNVAVAGSPLAAVCAAQGFSGVTVIPAGEEGLRIGSLSLEALRIPFEFVEP